MALGRRLGGGGLKVGDLSEEAGGGDGAGREELADGDADDELAVGGGRAARDEAAAPDRRQAIEGAPGHGCERSRSQGASEPETRT